MKLMTLNAHSHAVDFPEKIFESNLDVLAECIIREEIDVAALQESCQTRKKGPAGQESAGTYVPADPETVIREDNYVLQLIRRLEQKGYHYYWTWSGIKIGYGIFDEGLALVSRFPIKCVKEYYLTDSRDYENWKTRKALAVQTAAGGDTAWFVSVHMGWWEDEEEPFSCQMDRLQKSLKAAEGNVFLMGDFNSPSDQRNTGYDYVKSYGWKDTCSLLGKKNDITISGKIDGWGGEAERGLCIDYIWSKYSVDVISSRTVFSRVQEPVISDHYGVLAEIADENG